jgi:hypothetical protein
MRSGSLRKKGVFEDRPKNRQILTNLLAMMWILQTESGKLKQFVGARVSEVKVKSDVGKKEWYWLAGDSDPSNLKQQKQPN